MNKKTALITGSSNGLGKHLALEFANNGYNIILHGRDKNNLEIIKSEIERKNLECSIVLGDIKYQETVGSLVKVARDKNIDILVNNAGIYLNQDTQKVSDDKIKEIMDVNFFAPVKLVKGIFPVFQKKKSGLIININSLAGKNGSAGESIYCASKHALRGFFNSLKLEIINQKIKIIDFYLGAIKTQMTEGRKNVDLFIKPDEAARFIVNSCDNYSSLAPSEIDIHRRKYE